MRHIQPKGSMEISIVNRTVRIPERYKNFDLRAFLCATGIFPCPRGNMLTWDAEYGGRVSPHENVQGPGYPESVPDNESQKYLNPPECDCPLSRVEQFPAEPPGTLDILTSPGTGTSLPDGERGGFLRYTRQRPFLPPFPPFLGSNHVVLSENHGVVLGNGRFSLRRVGIWLFRAPGERVAAGLQRRIGKNTGWWLDTEVAENRVPVFFREDPFLEEVLFLVRYPRQQSLLSAEKRSRRS